jgi:hypothetical protein
VVLNSVFVYQKSTSWAPNPIPRITQNKNGGYNTITIHSRTNTRYKYFFILCVPMLQRWPHHMAYAKDVWNIILNDRVTYRIQLIESKREKNTKLFYPSTPSVETIENEMTVFIRVCPAQKIAQKYWKKCNLTSTKAHDPLLTLASKW